MSACNYVTVFPVIRRIRPGHEICCFLVIPRTLPAMSKRIPPGLAVAVELVNERKAAKRLWTIKDLATATDLHPDTLGDFLSAKRAPREDTLTKLEVGLDIDPGRLRAMIDEDFEWFEAHHKRADERHAAAIARSETPPAGTVTVAEASDTELLIELLRRTAARAAEAAERPGS